MSWPKHGRRTLIIHRYPPGNYYSSYCTYPTKQDFVASSSRQCRLVGKTPGLGAESLVKGSRELKRSQIVMNKFSGFCQKTVKIVRTRTRTYHIRSLPIIYRLELVLPLRSVRLIVNGNSQCQLHTIVSKIVYVYLLHE